MNSIWRSLQYVPAHVEKYAASPRILEADAVILDLQDSVPLEAKAQAREGAVLAAGRLASVGMDVLVRINEAVELAGPDIDACVGPNVLALVVPQVRSARDIRLLDSRLAAIEAAQGRAVGSTRLLALVESAEGLLSIAAIAKASPRILGLNLGNEDLATDLGVAPTEEALRASRQLLVIAAAAAGVTPYGLVASGSDFGDLDRYRILAEASRRMGFRGASCIHPSQIAILNDAFSPSAEEIDWARRVVEGAQRAREAGRAAFALDGRMIDPPIVARAQSLIDQQEAITLRRARRPSPS